MRGIPQTEAFTQAFSAGVLTAALCLPRVAFWQERKFPLWYAGVAIFFCATILWYFVLAWHRQYSGKPVLTLNLNVRLFAAATGFGVLSAVFLHFAIDPTMRALTPLHYPPTLGQWLAMTAFALSFNKLFQIFAPFAWVIRLSKSERAATFVTVLLGALLTTFKASALAIPPALLALIVFSQFVSGFVLVQLYLRGGLLLVWWCSLIVEARLLLTM
jgi:hypothetical protein